MRGMKPVWWVLAVIVLCAACRGQDNVYDQARRLTGGDPGKGMLAIDRYGCGGCHAIPGVAGATATVAPSLANVASRKMLGGNLPNTPANMMLWIEQPEKVDPKQLMPNMGVTEQDARDITAYLYTLR